MKKLFYISLGIFGLTLLFLGVYNFAFKNNPNNATADAAQKHLTKEETKKDFLSGLKSSPAEPITNETIVSAELFDDQFILYVTPDGKIKKITYGGGGGETIMDQLPGKPLRVLWSPKRDAALILLNTLDGSRWHFVALASKTAIPLKKELSSPTWSNLGERIFYLYTDNTGKTAIDSAKPDGSDWKEHLTVSHKNFFLASIPKSASIAFWNRPNAQEETELYTYSANASSAKRILGGKFGGNYLWSPSGDTILLSGSGEKGGKGFGLGVTNQNGGELHMLSVPTFLPKATWSPDNQSIYYALPLSLPENAVIPNDYFDNRIHSSDTFWKIDVKTGKKDRIIDADGLSGNEFDSTDLFVSPDESSLFFTNKKDGKLYRIHIKQE